jgi:hypothetical protein
MSVIVLAHTRFKPCGMGLRARGLLWSEASPGYSCENITVSVRECGSVHKSGSQILLVQSQIGTLLSGVSV